MRIRRAQKSDSSQIYLLGSSIEEFSVNDCGENFWPVDTIERLIDSRNDVIMVADDCELVGFSIITGHPLTSKATWENCYVLPNYRGRGIAEELYEVSEKKIIALGYQHISGFVEKGNRASLRMLEKEGFIRGKDYHWMLKML